MQQALSVACGGHGNQPHHPGGQGRAPLACLLYRGAGLRAIARWPKGAYLRAGELWLAIEIGDPVYTPGDRSHIAFAVTADDFTALGERIKKTNAIIWQENWTEGNSLYFLDPDGHKLEIHASDLAARLASAREQPWEGLEFLG